MCHHPAKQTYADKAAAAAHLPQPAEKLKLLPKGNHGWTALCPKCDRGVYDPDCTIESCPACKTDLITSKGTKKPPPATSSVGMRTKQAIAVVKMLGGIGPDGAVPKSPEILKAETKLSKLKKYVENLQGMPEGDFGPQLAAWSREIKELEKNILSPEAAALQTQTAIAYTLAELEQKAATAKRKFQEELAAKIQKRDEAATQGQARLQEIIDEQQKRITVATQTTAYQVAQAEEAIKAIQKKIEDYEKETSEEMKRMKTQATPVLQRAATGTAAMAGPQTALIQVAPGAVVHSNHLSAETFQQAFAAMGITPEMSQALAQQAIQTVGNQAMIVPHQASPAKEALAAAPVQTQVNATAAPETVVIQVEAPADQQESNPDLQMEELTDISDPDNDLHNANSGLPPVSKKKKVTKAVKKSKAAAGASASTDQKAGREKPGKK